MAELIAEELSNELRLCCGKISLAFWCYLSEAAESFRDVLGHALSRVSLGLGHVIMINMDQSRQWAQSSRKLVLCDIES